MLCFSRLKRHPTPPPAAKRGGGGGAAATGYKSFNSLYDPADDAAATASGSISQTLTLSSMATTVTTTDDDDEGSCSSSPDLSTAIASRRFFTAAPGRSNSIVDAAAVDVGAATGVAVPTYSPDPYLDFRRSMEEMAAALGIDDPRAHRARLHELLLCYLALNRKHAHRYILAAFADIIAAAEAAAADGDDEPC